MLTFGRYLTAEYWRHGDRAWYGSLGVSTCVHLALLALLACLWSLRGGDEGARGPGLDSRWSSSVLPESLDLAPLTPPENVQEEARDRLESTPSVLVAASEQRLREPEPFPTEASPHDWWASVSPEALVAEVGGPASGGGAGEGDGSGFFGIQAEGKRFVYVVDCSGSMNLSHRSEDRTRFGRLKRELLQSIESLDPEMEFYIIFFNHEAHPMPARGMQRATTEKRQEALEWVARFPAFGNTDPRRALQMALKFQPDAIYFLTDGSFLPPIQADLRKLSQNRAAIHTFAFGDRSGQGVLRAIAKNNNGRYCYVP